MPACGKLIFRTKAEAKRMCRLQEARHRVPTRPYRCSNCFMWHLTTIPKDKWNRILKARENRKP